MCCLKNSQSTDFLGPILSLPRLLLLLVGVNMFYICIIVYLYGDLAIYAAAVPISLMEVAW